MDLGIKGKKAIVCAASKGLGKGCAQALAREGVDVTICARGADALNATAKEIQALGVKVTPVACDVTTEAGRKALLAGAGRPHLGELGAALAELVDHGPREGLVDVDHHLLDRLQRLAGLRIVAQQHARRRHDRPVPPGDARHRGGRTADRAHR